MVTDKTTRPLRADAQRNYDRIVATARDAFAECGNEVPLDDIAKRACVGAGTLYRHFPTRETLYEAVYRGEITTLCERAPKLLAELPPTEALAAWVGELVQWVANKRSLAMTLKASIDSGSETFRLCQTMMREAAGTVLSAAQATGVIRLDIGPADLMRLGHGIGVSVEHADPEDADRLVSIMLDGLRA
ncbi:MAG: TetR family transcriptional regulator [Amycolatopsis sp.]|nr:TetR family transcriptional regulator [Amycolatopsis sp.]